MKAYLLAARPKTLPAAVVPVWVGCVWAMREEGVFDAKLALFTLLGAVWIQIATNFFNDAIDSDKGADTEKRIGPTRATASGQLPRQVVYAAALFCLGLASICGYFLFLERGWPILLIGIPSLYLSYGYTGGPLPLAYRGLGELFVILFFGLVAVTGTYFVQTGFWTADAVMVGLAIGCLSAVLISINNLRDIDEDRSNKKNTLAVQWGRGNCLKLLLLMILLPYVYVCYLEVVWKWLFYLPAFLLGILVFCFVRNEMPSEKYNRYLALSALQLILFAGAMSLAFLF